MIPVKGVFTKSTILFSLALVMLGGLPATAQWSAQWPPWTQGPFFWREKPLLQEKMKQDRYVPVLVSQDKTPSGSVWWMKGAGVVKAPGKFVYHYATDFEKLKKLPDHFSQVEWNAETSELSFEISILAIKRSFRMKMEKIEHGQEHNLHFVVIDGPYKGGEGLLMVKDMERQQSEVGLIGRFAGEMGWMPGFIISFAIEGLLHHVATSLRSQAEAQYATGT